MKNLILSAILVVAAQMISAQVAYKLFDKEGNEVSYEKMIKSMAKSDVILLGEQHNNPISHWMQLRITQDVYAKNGTLSLGAEMFESDGQLLINEYFDGHIRTKDFEKEMRLWDNYKTDYKPLLEFARKNNLKFTATNIPRRYAAIVNRNGFEALDSLSDDAKKYIAPLPMVYDTNNPSVQKMLHMDFGHGMGGAMVTGMAKSQATKDATMAHFILENKEKKKTFIHYQGDFHSANYGGIYWYLNYWNSKLKISTLSTVNAKSLEFTDDLKGSADYILIVVDDMTTTY